MSDLLPHITKEDIKNRLLRITKNTTAGPDGLTKENIEGPRSQEIIRLLYVFITACGKQPTAWKENRTVLLLKQGKDPKEAKNYRPITISSILCRAYWGSSTRN
jgi:hypothetical protein